MFNAKPARPPATEAEKATLKISLALYPCQPQKHQRVKLHTLTNSERGDESMGIVMSPGPQAFHSILGEPHQDLESATIADKQATDALTVKQQAIRKSHS